MKEKFIKSTIILILGGIFTKILGMLYKIILTRYLSAEGIGLYMMILPTFILFINIASFGFPIALSKMISEDDKNNKRLLSTSIISVLLINLFLILLILIISKPLSIHFLHNSKCIYPIMATSLVIPFTSIESIIKSYFFGKQKMIPLVLSNILEDIAKILIIVILLPHFKNYSISYIVTFIILMSILSEVVSILTLILFLPKKTRITKRDLKPSKTYLKSSLSIGIPTTLSKLVGSITYFLEPIILTSVLLYIGYKNSYIIKEYGILSGYSIPIILLPNFFSIAISQALLPVISKEYKNKNLKEVKRKIKQAITYSLIIGIPFTICLILFPNIFLKLIYNTNKGISYIRFLAPICLLQYIQAPLCSSLDAMGLSNKNFYANLSGSIVRIVFLPLLSLFKIGLWGLVISTSINIIVVTVMNIKQIKIATNYIN